MKIVIRAFLVALLLAGSGFATDAGAQILEPGTRVRVATPILVTGVQVRGYGAWQVGEVVAMDTRSVTLQTDQGELFTVQFLGTTRMERSHGAINSAEGAFHGIRTGALLGLGLSAGYILLGKAVGDQTGDEVIRRDEPTSMSAAGMAQTVVIGTGVGAALGYLFGSQMPERWIATEIPRPAFTIDGHGAPGVAFAIRF